MTTCGICGLPIELKDPAGFDFRGGFNFHACCEVEHCVGTADYPYPKDEK